MIVDCPLYALQASNTKGYRNFNHEGNGLLYGGKMKKIKAVNSQDTLREVKISAIQLQAINSVLTEKNIDVALKKVGLSRQTFYNWLKNETFKTAYEQAKSELVGAALDALQANLEKAISVYSSLLNSENENIRRQVAEGIIAYNLKLKENLEFENRLENLEKFILIERESIEITRCYDE